MLIAEHSMCHPGNPGPQGEGHASVLPGSALFQSAKSTGSRLRGSTSPRTPCFNASPTLPESFPYPGKRFTAK